MESQFRGLFLLTFASCAGSAPALLLAPATDPPAPRVSPSPKQETLFKTLQVEDAWKVTKGDPKVIVGVIDSGFDYFHPALKGAVEPGFYYAGGYHPEIFTNLAHGTMVLGLVVAQPQEPDSMCGLAPGCRALTASWGTLENPVAGLRAEFYRQHPDATPQDFQKELAKNQDALRQWGARWATYQVGGAAEAIRYLVDHGCRVINFSGLLLKSQCPSQEAWGKLEEAFAHAAGNNVVIVLAAGNDAFTVEDYPGDSRSVIVVGATLLNDKRWEEVREGDGRKLKIGSNMGKRLTCMAPVEKLFVCAPHDRRVYAWDSGPLGPMKIPFNGAYDVRPNGATSAAAPTVSALAALVVSARPALDAKAIVRLIETGCDDIGEPGHDLSTGYGRVNFATTLRLALREGKKQ